MLILIFQSSKPLVRRKPIRTITASSPNDPQSPFFNEDGEKMNPIAKLHFRRQRLYDETCEIKESCSEMKNEDDENANEEEDEEREEEAEEQEEVEGRVRHFVQKYIVLVLIKPTHI